MKISIAMATYNGAEYLEEQLQSFADQTRPPDELIITDDCSTDQTEAIVREFAKTVPFNVKFYQNEENLGYCGNFNAALMRTTGDLVFLSDQDDVWFSKKIETIASKFDGSSCLFINDAAVVTEHLELLKKSHFGTLFDQGKNGEELILGCCMAISKKFLDHALPIPENADGHDRWLSDLAVVTGQKFYHDEALQYYRRHRSNVTKASAYEKSSFLISSLFKRLREDRNKWILRKLNHHDALVKKIELGDAEVDLVKFEKYKKNYNELMFRRSLRMRPHCLRFFFLCLGLANYQGSLFRKMKKIASDSFDPTLN